MNSSQTKPLVSIGIPTYNNPEGLLRTLRSMTDQTYKNFELIISDNCSPREEEIKKIIEQFSKENFNIKYYRQSENQGAIFNFEFVLKKATGKYFMWAADDDEWDNAFIETGVKALQESNFYQAWFCCYDVTDSQGRVIMDVSNYSSLTSTADRRKNIIKYLTVSDISGKDCMTYAIYDRLALVETVKRYFFRNRKKNYGCDTAFNVAFLAKYNILISNEILYHKQINIKNDSSTIDNTNDKFVYRGIGRRTNLCFRPWKIISVIRENCNAVKGTAYTKTVILTLILSLPRVIINYLIVRADRKYNSIAKRIKPPGNFCDKTSG